MSPGSTVCARPPADGALRLTGVRRAAIAVVALALLLPGEIGAQDPAGAPGLELTSPVRLQLRLINEQWGAWTRAFEHAQEETAATALDELLGAARRLGMPRLPDLSSAASALAVSAAISNDFDRSRWALEAARRLDPARPEIHFAAATVKRLEGDYLGVAKSSFEGCAAILRLPLERSIWLHNVGLWLLYTVFVSGGLFVALQMATKGGALIHDLIHFMSPPLPSIAGQLLAVLALLWPLILPSGLLWLAVFWSILLWGYGSASERAVLIVLWLSLGTGSLVLSFQQRAVQLSSTAPIRAIENLSAGRLYGALFSDLSMLRAAMPQHPVTRELTADVHRRLGQWEHARSLYTTLLEAGELEGANSAPARNNLGVYHHRRKDYGTAVNYFLQATQYDPSMAEAFFNLAQAYSQLYQFADSNSAMAEAKALDRGRVTVWERVEAPVEELAVGVDGGLRRSAELIQTLRSIGQREDTSQAGVELWRRHVSLPAVAAIMVLAFSLHLVRSRQGYRSEALESDAAPASSNRWASVLVPGLASARAGRGGQALLGILIPVALLMLPLMRRLGYRPPLAYELDPALPAGLALSGLALMFLIRARQLVRAGR